MSEVAWPSSDTGGAGRAGGRGQPAQHLSDPRSGLGSAAKRSQLWDPIRPPPSSLSSQCPTSSPPTRLVLSRRESLGAFPAPGQHTALLKMARRPDLCSARDFMCPWAALTEDGKFGNTSTPALRPDTDNPESDLWVPRSLCRTETKFPLWDSAWLRDPLLGFLVSRPHCPHGLIWDSFLKHLHETFPTACFWGTHPRQGDTWLPLRGLSIHPQTGGSALPLPGQRVPCIRLLCFQTAQWLLSSSLDSEKLICN